MPEKPMDESAPEVPKKSDLLLQWEEEIEQLEAAYLQEDQVARKRINEFDEKARQLEWDERMKIQNYHEQLVRKRQLRKEQEEVARLRVSLKVAPDQYLNEVQSRLYDHLLEVAKLERKIAMFDTDPTTYPSLEPEEVKSIETEIREKYKEELGLD